MNYINALIVKVLLPDLYGLIDELLSAQGQPDKKLVVRCRQLLPPKYVNSFSYKAPAP